MICLESNSSKLNCKCLDYIVLSFVNVLFIQGAYSTGKDTENVKISTGGFSVNLLEASILYCIPA